MCFVVCLLQACHETHFNSNSNASLSEFEQLAQDDMRIDMSVLHRNLLRMVRSDDVVLYMDNRTKAYYSDGGSPLWIDRNGLNPQADTLLKYINKVSELGFSDDRFRVSQIEKDIQRMRSFDFTDDHDINLVVARLDYNLTKAYLRYAVGQRYGFIDPAKVFNNLDEEEIDSLHSRFRQLYDMKTERAGSEVCKRLLGAIAEGSVGDILRDAQPTDALYNRLKSMLPNAKGAERNRILANMERCRWRHDMSFNGASKYVLVNIPSYHLLCVDGEDVQEMKMVCGSRKTKTPLLSSNITRMDLNPQWIMPFSVVKNEIAPHAGDVDYFVRRNYFIKEKKSGQRVSPEMVTYDDFRSGAYSVIQEGGEGNALGRIIFRFPNNHAIYLHDTSTKSAFGRADRSVSHGCIRVERPFDLARFLLKDKDEKLLEKIEYSMTVHTRVPADCESSEAKPNIDKSKILHSKQVEPQIPVLITYQTMIIEPRGQLRSYDDVYGYDAVISQILSNLQ